MACHRIGRDERVVTEHLQRETAQFPGHFSSNVTESDQAQRPALDAAPRLGGRLRPPAEADRPVEFGNPAHDRKQQSD